MSWKAYDYVCQDCGTEFEELVKDINETVECLSCGSNNSDRQFATPHLATMNLLPKKEYEAKMRKRSSDHTARMLAKEGYKGQGVIDIRKSK